MEYWHVMLIVGIWVACLFVAYPYLCKYTFCFGGDTPVGKGSSNIYECIVRSCTGEIEVRKVKSIWFGDCHVWVLPDGYQVLKYRIV